MDEIRRAALATVGSDKDAETERTEHPTKYLSSTWEDFDGLNEVFRVTHDSQGPIRNMPELEAKSGDTMQSKSFIFHL